jgi:hypothetical protein
VAQAPARPTRTHPLAALGLVLASLAVCLIAIEAAFVPLLHHLPRKLHVYLDPALRPLAASSKRAALPRDYVAIVGDSYAQGRGDWLLETDADTNGPYASAHVLFERSGRDVISWGRGGAGFLSGWVAFPLVSWRALQSSRRTALAPPSVLIAYLYEGNDLEDTLLELMMLRVLEDPAFPLDASTDALQERMAAEDRAQAVRDAQGRPPEQFASLVEHRLLPYYARRLDAPLPGWRPALYFPRFLTALARGEYARLRGRAPGWDGQAKSFGRNRVELAGRDVELPGSLQAPALELTDEELELALRAADLSLGMLASAFPSSALCVLRVPSPAALYTFAGEGVSVQALRGTRSASQHVIRARSDALGARARALAAAHAATYVDALPALRDAARTELIHGPRDWRHLNRRGQTVLGEVAAQCLAAPARARRAAAAAGRRPPRATPRSRARLRRARDARGSRYRDRARPVATPRPLRRSRPPPPA